MKTYKISSQIYADTNGEGRGNITLGCQMNIETALNFIQKHGNKIDRYRINYLLNERQNDEIPLKDLRNMQNTDGAFPYNFQKDKHSCVSQTCSISSLMRELDLKESDVCKKAFQFLFKNQKQDGNWGENPRIAEYQPPPWDMPDKIETGTWLTAEIANNLIRLGHNNLEQVRKSAKFLKKNRDEKGKVVGYRIATWTIIPVLAKLKGIENETVQKSLKLAGEWSQEEDTDASFLTWYLSCLQDAKIPQSNQLAQKCLEKLTKLQQENGSWPSVDGEKYNVSTTIAALKPLRDFSVWTE